jgi:hypothetical protein
MIVEQFDRRTMAAMELAPERACARWPYGGSTTFASGSPKASFECPNQKHQFGCID